MIKPHAVWISQPPGVYVTQEPVEPLSTSVNWTKMVEYRAYEILENKVARLNSEITELKAHLQLTNEGWETTFKKHDINAKLIEALMKIARFWVHPDGTMGGDAKRIAAEALKELE